MIPKIEFVYSWVYDEKFKLKKGQKKLDSKQIIKYKNRLEKEWKKIRKKVLKEITIVSGLKWYEKEIKCYIVDTGIPFSDPLTLPVYKKVDDGIDMLTHELIHQIFDQGKNLKKSKKSWDYIFKKYKKESFNTQIHIPLHAIHKHIYLKYFGKKRLQRDIDFFQKLVDYKRSWDVVEKDGYKNVINEFKKLIK